MPNTDHYTHFHCTQPSEKIQKAIIEKYNKIILGQTDPFLTIGFDVIKYHFSNFPNITSLYLFLKTQVNRNPNTNFANLGQYYQDHYLVTARHQTWLTTKTTVNQSTLSRWLEQLKKKKLIKVLGQEQMRRSNGKYLNIPIISLGEHYIYQGKYIEVFYDEIGGC